ncbi:Mediator of RNA polymerase II transcription subunit 7 [Plasmodiophora brassicae]|nr:hypothetical protein PBRA_008616 [Plasmodiophora brassicae]
MRRSLLLVGALALALASAQPNDDADRLARAFANAGLSTKRDIAKWVDEQTRTWGSNRTAGVRFYDAVVHLHQTGADERLVDALMAQIGEQVCGRTLWDMEDFLEDTRFLDQSETLQRKFVNSLKLYSALLLRTSADRDVRRIAGLSEEARVFIKFHSNDDWKFVPRLQWHDKGQASKLQDLLRQRAQGDVHWIDLDNDRRQWFLASDFFAAVESTDDDDKDKALNVITQNLLIGAYLGLEVMTMGPLEEDVRETSMLMRAADDNNLVLVRAIVGGLRASPNDLVLARVRSSAMQSSAMHYARTPECLQILLSAGGNLMLEDSEKHTVLDDALVRMRQACIDRDELKRNEQLDLAREKEALHQDLRRKALFVLGTHGDPDMIFHKDGNSRTAVHLAAMLPDASACEIMVEILKIAYDSERIREALTCVDFENKTPLSLAVELEANVMMAVELARVDRGKLAASILSYGWSVMNSTWFLAVIDKNKESLSHFLPN